MAVLVLSLPAGPPLSTATSCQMSDLDEGKTMHKEDGEAMTMMNDVGCRHDR